MTSRGQVTELVKVLPLCGHVRDLNLGGNRIDYDAMVELSSVLPRCSKLEKINLRDNRITSMSLCCTIIGSLAESIQSSCRVAVVPFDVLSSTVPRQAHY